MKNWILTVSLGFALSGCGGGFPLSPTLANDWNCIARDSNGNPYFGIARDKQAAVDKARWQCVSGSPYKQSCKAEPAYCEQLE